MKTLTTLTAVALIAGLSAAGAQNAATPNQKVPPPSSINAGGNTLPSAKSGSQTTGAQAGGAGTMDKSALSVNGNSRFCIKTPTGNSLDCQYASMAACQEVAKPGNKVCMSNPQAGTTGAGMKTDNNVNMKKQ